MSTASAVSRADPAREAIRRFVTETPLNAAMIDREGLFIEVSASMIAATGIPREDCVGAPVDVVFDGAVGIEGLLAACAATGGVTFPPKRVVLPNGEDQWVQSTGTVWRDDAGEVGGLVVVNRNITAEQHALVELSRAEAMLDAIVESIPSMLSVQDAETGAIVRVNRATEESTGRPREEILDQIPLQHNLEAFRRRLAAIELAQATTDTVYSEEEVPTVAGRHRVLQVRRRIIENREGKQHVLSVAEDITEKKLAEAALKAAVAEADAANRAKSAFLAIMSHEIRTPLNGVLGMAQAMARDELPDTQRQRLDVIRQSGETLLAILNDILDLSKIEAGKLDIESIDFDLADVVEAAAGGYAAMAAAKGLDFVVDMGDAEGTYRGDPTRLRQVVSNLISNAVKFSDAGAVRVIAGRDGDGVSLTVSDTGVGIEAAALDRLFDKFMQADSSTTRRYGGTGLGLAICRELAEAMGGTISAESLSGKGASFTLKLPLKRVGEATHKAVAPQAHHEAQRSLRVLAAEDNPVNQLVLKTIFEQAGLDVTVVGDGVQVVEAYKAQAWDVILMDVQMPVMDGVDATRTIRAIEHGEGRLRTPIIALTANAMEHQKADYLACGMDRLVAKPLQIVDLFDAIEALIDQPPQTPELRTAAAGG